MSCSRRRLSKYFILRQRSTIPDDFSSSKVDTRGFPSSRVAPRGKGSREELDWLKLTPTFLVRQYELTTSKLGNRQKRWRKTSFPWLKRRVSRRATPLFPSSSHPLLTRPIVIVFSIARTLLERTRSNGFESLLTVWSFYCGPIRGFPDFFWSFRLELIA